MKIILNCIETSFVVFVLLFSTTPFTHLIPAAGGLTQAIWYVVYAIVFFLIFMRWRQFVYVFTRDKLLLLLVGIALVSVLWSAAPELTLRRSFALFCTTMLGAYLATRYALNEQVRLLCWTFSILVLVNLGFCLIMPTYGIDSGVHAGAWQGIYHQKNILGRLMSLSSVFFLLKSLSSHRYRWFLWTGFCLSFSMLLLSGAKTSLVIFIVLLILLPFFNALRWSSGLKIPFFIVVVILSGGIATWFTSIQEGILTSLERDSTLTGRLPLWSTLLDVGRDRPLLGWGYNAFWLGWQGEESSSVWSMHPWQPNHAHNAFLDLYLNLGLIGLSVFVLCFLCVCIKATNWVLSTRTAEGFWPLIYMIYLLLINQTESTLLLQNNIFWLLYVTMGLSMTIQRRTQGSKTNTLSENPSTMRCVRDV
jgi:exopolysaccharide production protein ExoQ